MSNYYVFYSDDGKKIGITKELYEKYKDNPLYKDKLSSMVLDEDTQEDNPEYGEFLQNLNRDYAASIYYPDSNMKNYRGLSSLLPNGYSMTSLGVLIGPNGEAYVLKGFRYGPRYRVDNQNPLTILFNKGTTTLRTTLWYPVETPAKYINQYRQPDYIIDEGVIKNSTDINKTTKLVNLAKSFSNRSTFSKEQADKVLQSLLTSGGILVSNKPAPTKLKQTNVIEVRPPETHSFGSLINENTIELKNNANYETLLREALARKAPETVVDLIKTAASNYNKLKDELYLAAGYTPELREMIKYLIEPLAYNKFPSYDDWMNAEDVFTRNIYKYIPDDRGYAGNIYLRDFEEYEGKPFGFKIHAIPDEKVNLLYLTAKKHADKLNNWQGKSYDYNTYYTDHFLPAQKAYRDYEKLLGTTFKAKAQKLISKYNPQITFPWLEEQRKLNPMTQKAIQTAAPSLTETVATETPVFLGKWNFGNGVYYKTGGKLKLLIK